MAVFSGWKVQEMKAVRPPVSSWSLADALQVLDALLERLDVAEHHRGRRPAAEAVPGPVDLQPVVGEDLAAGDRLADAVDEDLAAAAGRLPRPASFSRRSTVSAAGGTSWRRSGSRRAEPVTLTPGKWALMSRSSSSLPLAGAGPGAGPPASGSGRRPARRSPRFLQQDVALQDVGLGVADLAVEGAEVADRGADVGVVDVAVDVVGAVRLGVEPAADRVGGVAERQQVGLVSRRAPSSTVAAGQSTARCKIEATVEDKSTVLPWPAQRGGHPREQASPANSGVPAVIGITRRSDNRSRSRGQPQPTGRTPRQRAGHAPAPRRGCAPGPRATRPGRPRPAPPRGRRRTAARQSAFQASAEVDRPRGTARRDLHRPVADQEDGVGRALLHRHAQGQLLDPAGPHAVRRVEPDACQRLARARPASRARRPISPNGTRLNSLTLRTGPRAAMANPGSTS
jgi:hypothetical protein